MALKDILISLATHPDATPHGALAYASGLARQTGASLSAVIWELKITQPGTMNFLANTLLDLPGLIQAEVGKSQAQAQELARAFKAAAESEGTFGGCVIERCAPVQVPDLLAEHGRFHDLTIVPVLEDDATGPMHAEAVIFGAGRPALVLPEGAFARGPKLDRAVIACDFSRPAARAIADALPLLKAAREVQAITVVNEKPLKTSRSANDLERHLGAHGIAVKTLTVDAGGRPIGEVLAGHVRSAEADLLVMGAYGHSRLQEFVLGGATNSMVRKPPTAVLLSH